MENTYSKNSSVIPGNSTSIVDKVAYLIYDVRGKSLYVVSVMLIG
jgi:hypothetical protein